MADSEQIRVDIKGVLKEKNPALAKIVPGFIINYLRKIVHEEELNQFLASYGDLENIEFIRASLTYMGISYQVHNKHNIPSDGRYIFVSNHPLGGLDGLVFIAELAKYFNNIKFPVNDILMNINNLSGIFLPVNKHGSQARDAVVMIDQTYASDAQVLYFPAGLCSRKKSGVIKDLHWQKSFVTKAIKHKRDIVPVYFAGRNSDFFYRLSNIRKRIGLRANIEMLYLPDEMFRQKGQELHLVFGETISWQSLDNTKTPSEWASWIRDRSYELSDIVTETK